MKDNEPYPTEPPLNLSDSDIARMFDQLKYERWKKQRSEKVNEWMKLSEEIGGE